jgi:hypothetical protein
MDFEKLILKQGRCVIKDPRTEEDTDIVIFTVGPGSREWKDALHQKYKWLSEFPEGDEPSSDEMHERTCMILASCAKGWENMSSKGKALEFSTEAALAVYKKSEVIRSQVDQYMTKQSNFLPDA